MSVLSAEGDGSFEVELSKLRAERLAGMKAAQQGFVNIRQCVDPRELAQYKVGRIPPLFSSSSRFALRSFSLNPGFGKTAHRFALVGSMQYVVPCFLDGRLFNTSGLR
jgi:hypothetical protein